MKYYPICEQCVNGEGSECNNPECSYCRNDVPPKMSFPEFGIDINDKMCSVSVLEAAIRWMEYYGKPINDEHEYKEMIYDDRVGESYKQDINSIRKALGKSVISI